MFLVAKKIMKNLRVARVFELWRNAVNFALIKHSVTHINFH